MDQYSKDYLLDKKVRMFQGTQSYRTSSDAVLVSSLIHNLKPGENILDVGSGNGGISLCLAYRFPDHEIVGLELQPELLEISQKNALENGFSNLTYYQNDIRNKKTLLTPCRFAHVISNPPYSDHDQTSPNASKSLAHNHHDFDLKGWIDFCLKMLKPYGFLYLINRTEALTEMMNCLCKRAGNIQIIPVFSKRGQNAKRLMLIAQKDSKTPAKILEPLYIHEENNDYTSKASKILRTGLSYFDL